MSDDKPSAFDKFKQKLFEEAERLQPSAKFKFGCHPGVPCFNKCCTDVNIFLTPYDVLRLKNRLNMDSEEFLLRYTMMPMDDTQRYPVVMFRMGEEENKPCQLLGENGCGVYEDRPWSCRMFPIGKASPKEENAMPFYFFMREDVCEGWKEETEWTIQGWMDDQGVEKYDEFGELYKAITLHDFFGKGGKLNPPQMEMFHMVCYNLDKFKLFIQESSFFSRFDVDDETKEKIMNDDEELLRFGFNWLRYALFKENTMKVNNDEAHRIKERNRGKKV